VQEQDNERKQVDAAWRNALTIWAALFAFMAIYPVGVLAMQWLGVRVGTSLPQEIIGYIKYGLFAVSAGTFAQAYFLRRKMLSNTNCAASGATPSAASRYLTAMIE
jgi:hypothetical protein